MHTIVEVVERQLEKNDKGTVFTFLTDGENAEQSVSLSDIRTAALKVGSLLPKKEAVVLLLPHGLSFISSFLGCLYAQALAIPVAVPTKNRGVEGLSSIITDASVSFGITTRSVLANLRRWFGADVLPINWIFIEEIELDGSASVSHFDLPKPEDIAFLQYTSGSTGKPKAVMVTHENIIANSRVIQKCFQNNSESVSVCWLPSFHDMGLIDGILQPVFSGFRAVLLSPAHFLQKPVRWFRAITKYRATYSGAPNFAFDFCNERIRDEELAGVDLSSLRCLYNGSETIRQQTIRKFVDRFSAVGFAEEKMFTCYGLAESTLAVTTSKLGIGPRVVRVKAENFAPTFISAFEDKSFIDIVGCGKADGNTTLKIIDPVTNDECREREIGEVWVAGKSVVAGYFNDPISSRETFVARDGKRYLRTGDLGFLSEDELFVTGRSKDLIVIRGKNHFPQDIEETVSDSHAALRAGACAAFSAEIEAEEKLVVVQEVRRSFLKRVDYREIFGCILTSISQRHEVSPFDVVLISPNTLPKTGSGKIQRDACRKLWYSQALNSLAYLNEELLYKRMNNEN